MRRGSLNQDLWDLWDYQDMRWINKNFYLFLKSYSNLPNNPSLMNEYPALYQKRKLKNGVPYESFWKKARLNPWFDNETKFDIISNYPI